MDRRPFSLLALAAAAFLAAVIFPPLSRPAAAQTVIYVDAAASGTGGGTSWTDAYPGLQEALSRAQSISGPAEIWVAEGTYRPTLPADPADGRTVTFQLLDGVGIYGGFRGGETSRSARDPQAYETILSGDVGSVGFAGDNAYHVVTGSNAGPSAVLDGVTITGGQANGPDYDDRDGGGMYNEQGSPTLRNCRFVGNRAQGEGGAVYNWYRSSPLVASCVFEDNAAGFQGGAVSNGFESAPRLEDVRFVENSAGLSGGALSNFNSSPVILRAEFTGNVSGFSGGAVDNAYNSSAVLLNVRFAGNVADYTGGALANDDSDPSITNAVFSGNVGSDGGAVHNAGSSPMITGATFSGNRADDGFGGGAGGAIANESESFPQIRNSILWGNRALGSGDQLSLDATSQPLVGHSIVEGGLPDGAFDDGQNSARDPRFESPVDPGAAPTVAGDLRVLADGAPGLDAADPSRLPADRFDLDGDGNTAEPLPVDLEGTDRIVDNNADGTAAPDLGAYEAPASVLPVELAFLEAEADGRDVHLTWQTASETDNAGFVVERLLRSGGSSQASSFPESASHGPSGPARWENLGFVEGAGTTVEARDYRFVDPALPPGISALSYRLKQVDLDGSAHYSDAVEVALAPPTELRLYAPYPNPSKGRATVRFAVPEGMVARLSVYDVAGRRVALLPPGEVPPGEHSRLLDTSRLASGLYLLRLQAESQTVTRKMSVVR